MNVTRYDPDCEYIGAGDYAAYMMSCPNGNFVEYDDYAKLEAERDALRGVLEEISHDEGRFGLSASDMRELAKQVLARTALVEKG